MLEPEQSSLAPFSVEQAELTIQVNLSKPFWGLVHNIPALYSALLAGLKEFGVTSRSIRTDAGDGSLGAYSVAFWMLNFRAIGHIRLEQIELQCMNLTVQDVEPMSGAFVALVKALATADPELAVANYSVSLGLHGRLSGLEHKEFVARFVRNVPTALGQSVGNGVVFYFGERGQATFRTLTLDLSASIPGGLLVRMYSVFSGTLQPSMLRQSVQEELEAELRALGLARQS